jgi:chromatin segregation and condensation protein Rec8/ScpA/Scc1 (kleisin family)
MFRFFREGTAASPAEMRHEAVVTFLALLEMAKLRLIALSQQPDEEEIFIARTVDDLRDRVSVGIAKSDEYR